MNERIRELAILARKFATSRDPFDEYDVSFDETKFEQKFAELIVRECARRAEAYAYMSQNFNALAEELRGMIGDK